MFTCDGWPGEDALSLEAGLGCLDTEKLSELWKVADSPESEPWLTDLRNLPRSESKLELLLSALSPVSPLSSADLL